ncbi:polysaccharide biosynthesis C-terminal domain-containing protein [Sphingobacterium sp. IITKGP-BTPF85]|uniref:polysaccharide biosynthesis C-terminal domain-containing protein n=1 Tax=Sphingobacterium sp. IITKGP-BTPF85 TaxID=1338009 RepID=UPI0018CCB2D4
MICYGVWFHCYTCWQLSFYSYWGIYAAAWTTLICYASMMVVTYFLGQKYYYIPYPVKKIGTYLLAMLLCFFMKMSIDAYSDSWTQGMQLLLRIPVAIILMIFYVFFIVKMERKELKNIPLIGKYI